MDLFTRLMDAGADGGAGWRGCHGRTLLGAAACGNREEMVLVLLEAGAEDDVNVLFETRKGEPAPSAPYAAATWRAGSALSALRVAAANGADKICDALMLAGADPNVLDTSNESPLHRVAEAGHQSVLNALLLKGADPNARTRREGQTPLHIAAAEGHALCVSKLVIGGADKDFRDLDGRTPLYLAAGCNRVAAVEELLTAGADVGIRDTTQNVILGETTAFGYAAQGGYVGVLRAFMRHGSNVKASDEDGVTALHHAAAGADLDNDNTDAIRLLLEAGVDIDAKGMGRTPLHFAASTDSSATIRALLKGGANVNARTTGEDETPLITACSRSCANVVEILLRWGADEKATNNYGKTAEDTLGQWQRFEDSYYQEGRPSSAQTKRSWADDQRIRHMLARAPADRSWRRRGWLVLARCCPAKVQLVQESGDGGGSSDSSAKIAKASSGDGERSKDETASLERLVGRVVGLNAEGVFRLVVGFL